MNENFRTIPLNPYTLMEKYLKLLKLDYVNEQIAIVLLEFIAEQELLDEVDVFLKEKFMVVTKVGIASDKEED